MGYSGCQNILYTLTPHAGGCFSPSETAQGAPEGDRSGFAGRAAFDQAIRNRYKSLEKITRACF